MGAVPNARRVQQNRQQVVANQGRRKMEARPHLREGDNRGNGAVFWYHIIVILRVVPMTNMPRQSHPPAVRTHVFHVP